MRYVRVVNGVITVAAGGLPAESTRLDTGATVTDLATRSADVLEACGWFPWSEPGSGRPEGRELRRVAMRERAVVAVARLDRITDYDPPSITTNAVAQAELVKTMTAVRDMAVFMKAIIGLLLDIDND